MQTAEAVNMGSVALGVVAGGRLGNCVILGGHPVTGVEVRSGRLCCQISSCPYNLNFLFPEGLIVQWVHGSPFCAPYPFCPKNARFHSAPACPSQLLSHHPHTSFPPPFFLHAIIPRAFVAFFSLFHPVPCLPQNNLSSSSGAATLTAITCSYERKKRRRPFLR